MRIALTVGHSLLKNGSYTSASGEDCGGVNEYKYCLLYTSDAADD